MTEEGQPKIMPYIGNTSIPSRSDVAIGIGLSAQNITFRGFLSKSETRIQTAIHTLSLYLNTPSKSVPTPSTDDTIFSFRLAGLNVDTRASQVRLCWMDLTTVVGHRGPELVTAVAISLKHMLLQSLMSLHLIECYSEAVIQTLAYQIMHFSESLTIIDPLSTIQPSYLVQKGIPHALRTDSTFRFLFHLRHCLRRLRPEDRNYISLLKAVQTLLTPTHLHRHYIQDLSIWTKILMAPTTSCCWNNCLKSSVRSPLPRPLTRCLLSSSTCRILVCASVHLIHPQPTNFSLLVFRSVHAHIPLVSYNTPSVTPKYVADIPS